MKILAFEASKIHGYLNHKILFNKDITYLTGINGTGKTSIVRSILCLTQPYLIYLIETSYEFLRVRVEVENVVHDIIAKKDEKEFKLYKISYTKGKVARISTKIENLTQPDPAYKYSFPLISKDNFESEIRFRDRLLEYISEQETLSVNHPLIQFLRNIPTPMFLGLERRSETELQDDSRRIHPSSKRIRGIFTGSIYESLIEAKRLAEESYFIVINEQRDAAIKFRKDIILSMFKIPSRNRAAFTWPQQDYLENNNNKIEELKRALNSIEIEDVLIEKQMMPFFRELESTVTKLLKFKDAGEALNDEEGKQVFFRWITLAPQEVNANEIFKLVEAFRKRSQELRHTITKFEKLTNSFLQDSGKKLKFSPNGNLTIELPNTVTGNLTSLSSGESHIVVILTNLFFNKRNNSSNVMIIDEPELSLHIKWQEAFVDAVVSASSNLQIILATHSPAIFLDNISQCVDLS